MQRRANPYRTKNEHPKTGPTRGLIKVAQQTKATSGRQLLHTTASLPRKWGTCRWCGQKAPTGRHLWHEECKYMCSLAHGQTPMFPLWLKDNPLWVKHEDNRWAWKCAGCGEQMQMYYEIDHAISLAVAFQLKRLGAKNWWRAWHWKNLQPLCRFCHGKKSGKDRILLNQLKVVKSLESPELETLFFESLLSMHLRTYGLLPFRA